MKIEPMSVEQIKDVVLDWVDDCDHGIADESDSRAVWAYSWAHERARGLVWSESDPLNAVLDEIGWPKDARK